MNPKISIRPEAELDLADAAQWYESQQPGLGHQFLDEALAIFSAIATSPQIWQIAHRNTRRALLHRFPFGVYYRIEQNAIVVIAVMHGSRHPHRWKGR